jgi:hypothetical protein
MPLKANLKRKQIGIATKPKHHRTYHCIIQKNIYIMRGKN